MRRGAVSRPLRGPVAMVTATPKAPPFAVPVRFQRRELAALARLSDDAVAALGRSSGPEKFIDELLAQNAHRDLLATLAFLLPKREAVWTACLAARLVESSDSSAAQAALRAAEGWVQSGSEEARRAAGDAAEACDHQGPPAWAALGAYWSGGSIAPPSQDPVQPASHLTATAVRTAMFEAVQADGPSMADLAAVALDVLAGGAGRAAVAAIMKRRPANAKSAGG